MPADPRSEILTALRSRLVTAAGATPVYYHGEPSFDAPPTGIAHYRESLAVPGVGNDSAKGGGTTQRWRTIHGSYQVMCCAPLLAGEMAVLVMASTVEQAFLYPTSIALASGWPLLIDDTKVLGSLNDPNWLKLPLVCMFSVTYTL
jgi:hypothetical protein